VTMTASSAACPTTSLVVSVVSVVIVACAWLLRGLTGCYLYPEDVGPDPCIGRRCSYGAQCRRSVDGLTARCQCPDRCDQYGDSVDAGPRCGDDGVDYASECHLRLSACRQLQEIRAKFVGRCGVYRPTDTTTTVYISFT